MLCLFLLLVQTNAVILQPVETHIQNTTNAVILQPIETHIQNTDAQKKKQLLGSVLSDPKKFIAQATNLDPFAVQDIITLLDALLRTSKHKEQDIVDTLEDELSRLVKTGEELSDAVEAVDVANGAVKAAKEAVTVAEGVVTEKEGILRVKSEEHEAADLAHTGALDARDTAQAELDDLKPGLDKEQAMLIDVNKMLGQLTDILFSCEPGQGGENGPYLGERTNDNSREKCERRCRSTVGCLIFDYTTDDVSDACRLYSNSAGSRTDVGAHRRQFCIVEGLFDWRLFTDTTVRRDGGSNNCWDVNEIAFFSDSQCSVPIEIPANNRINSGYASSKHALEFAFDGSEVGSLWGGRSRDGEFGSSEVWIGARDIANLKCIKFTQGKSVSNKCRPSSEIQIQKRNKQLRGDWITEKEIMWSVENDGTHEFLI